MTTSLLRGLRALEMLGGEALGVSEIARRLGVDKAGVSRMLGQLHAEGWVLRTGARYVLGERALAMVTADPAEVRRRAARVAARLHERTGLTSVVVRLAGEGGQPVAVAGPTGFLDPEGPYEHLWCTAGGIALLAQLPDAELDRRLAVTPWPQPSADAPADADAVRALIRAVRAGAPAEERSWTLPGAGCIALPWPVVEPAPPYAVLALGPAADIDRDADAVRQALRDAVAR
ncbi:helix-turn-helix domain-containing protein [Nocardioides humi]|uniref:HTH iclR-type domain-containing protein n=1 Tax=Nocardioides humi TaxID=449461 RepID=A0ABN2BSZ0_9ACTN|nr:helix-turn-helix domain-containing protein [Nocardioides humi]